MRTSSPPRPVFFGFLHTLELISLHSKQNMFRSIDLKWMLKKFYLRWSSFVINISGNCKLSRWIEGCGGNLQFPPPRPGQPICFWNFILGRGSKKCEIYHCCHVGGLVGWPFRIIPGLPKHVIHMVWIVWCSSQASQMTLKVIIFSQSAVGVVWKCPTIQKDIV